MKQAVIKMVLMAAIVAASLTPARVRAADEVLIDGTVKSATGEALAGYNVKLECDGSRGDASWTNTLFTKTDPNGYYSFRTPLCAVGNTLTIQANNNGLHSNYVYHTISQEHTSFHLKVTLPIVVPEYGWLAGMLAGGSGLGAVLLARRRSNQLPDTRS